MMAVFEKTKEEKKKNMEMERKDGHKLGMVFFTELSY